MPCPEGMVRAWSQRVVFTRVESQPIFESFLNAIIGERVGTVATRVLW